MIAWSRLINGGIEIGWGNVILHGACVRARQRVSRQNICVCKMCSIVSALLSLSVHNVSFARAQIRFLLILQRRIRC
jgi:hypothetical protein